MSITRQLYELHELDLQIKAAEQALSERVSQVGESQALIEARQTLNAEKQSLDELKRQQRFIETDISDLMAKIKSGENELYSGRIRNPKELSGLQQEVNSLKAKVDQLETRAIKLIDEVESTETAFAGARSHFERVGKEWQSHQQQLSVEITEIKEKLDALRQKRYLVQDQVIPEIVALYENLRTKKGHAVARVEQGICRSCGISLSSSQLQQARSGTLAQCGSCGRILFLP